MRAEEISENLLELTGIAYKAGDFALFATCFHLPHKIETFEGQRVIACEDDLRDVFESVRESFRRKGITKVDRRCVQAKYIDDKTVHATHESRLL